MKKLFILLFPEREYVKGEEELALFDQCIETRYLNKGYEFTLVQYKNSSTNFVQLKPDRLLEADITFEQSSPYFDKNWRYANFEYIASNVNAQNYEQIVVGGFHCFDCVERLAQHLYKINKNTLIDTDLTELFWSTARYKKDFVMDTFDPDLKIRSARRIATPMIETYKQPIYGVSLDLLESKRICNPTPKEDLDISD